jgi:hypothetical protein
MVLTANVFNRGPYVGKLSGTVLEGAPAKTLIPEPASTELMVVCAVVLAACALRRQRWPR